ncbi:hypothetical protein [Burkholderia cepacia]|uniref:hypothetical protein n=1 Tax=Burkholderia cepacia TaxID=292 RepID=UPI001CF58F3B|nr:hypothetical protein [Burkholderia cepacia]MCA8349945.1 hypothetical protein [Burkholderia cepacia]
MEINQHAQTFNTLQLIATDLERAWVRCIVLAEHTWEAQFGEKVSWIAGIAMALPTMAAHIVS